MVTTMRVFLSVHITHYSHLVTSVLASPIDDIVKLVMENLMLQAGSLELGPDNVHIITAEIEHTTALKNKYSESGMEATEYLSKRVDAVPTLDLS